MKWARNSWSDCAQCILKIRAWLEKFRQIFTSLQVETCYRLLGMHNARVINLGRPNILFDRVFFFSSHEPTTSSAERVSLAHCTYLFHFCWNLIVCSYSPSRWTRTGIRIAEDVRISADKSSPIFNRSNSGHVRQDIFHITNFIRPWIRRIWNSLNLVLWRFIHLPLFQTTSRLKADKR